MAMILDAFVGKFSQRLAAFLEEEVSSVLGVKGELKSLQKTLVKIGAVFKDAERRRIQDEAVKQWLNDLKDVMYDADDILDLCRYKGGRLLQDEPSSSSASPVRCYSPLLSCITNVPFRSEIGRRIKDLNNRLEKIHKDKQMFMFSLEPSKPDDMIRSLGGMNLRQTYSVLEEDGVVGSDIKEATDRLVELIVGEERQKCRVFAIVGMGGIGKTTLAQKVFNEPKIQSKFQEQRRVWVCISQSFSETDLLKEMIRCVGGHYGDAQTLSELMPIFMKQVTGTPLFLVLDDVWAADVLWDKLLRIPLQREHTSCTILVTTRKEEVAKRMGAVDVHRVEKLSVESGWEMLCKRVFINGEEEEEETIQSLKDIGIEIVEKCDGLPLAIKTIAGVLSGKEKTSGEWEKVVKSDAWSMSELPEGVGEALYLSYDDLPSHLKQCFLYLSLFPEDYWYDMNELVPLWTAEGLVEPDGRNSLEDTAEEYYKELIRRSLLHPDLNYCKMHDLLRSLACFLSGNERFCGNVKSISKFITSQARRLYIEKSEESGEVLTTESIIRPKHLRTLLLPSGYPSTPTFENGLISISRLGGLRVLSLNGGWIKDVPDSISDLIHLRYLNLDRNNVSKLPESLGRLTNLQFLSLSGCQQVHCLPNSIGDLIHMRFLLINNSGVSELPDSLTRLTNLRQLRMDGTPLTHVPKGIGKLQQLNYLSGVVMGSDNQRQGCNSEDLQDLSQLRFLEIRRLERASTGMLQLQRKSYLTELALSWRFSHQIDGDGDGQQVKIEKILNELLPPACLESLTLDDAGGFARSYPSWMSPSLLATLLPRLNFIYLMGFMSCPHVPPLGELPQLKSILIDGAGAVVTIGSEFMGAGVREGINELTSTAFPKLESLVFWHMDNWEEWSLDGKTTERENRSLILFPLLKRLEISWCPNLRVLPISSLPPLRWLTIRNCPALEDVGSHNALQMLQVDLYGEMECLPEWLIKLLQQWLQAEGSNSQFIFRCHVGLVRKCLMDGPYWPIIQQIPQVDVNSHTGGGYKYMRYTKVPFSYTTNLSSGSQDNPNV